MATAVGIIPARWASSRYPGKPLARIAGLPMIQRVWEGARTAKSLREVIVATDDQRIADVCEKFGARAVMTSPLHSTGTERVAEVAEALSDEVIVNIQGDEPTLTGYVVDAAVDALHDSTEASVATLVHRAEASAAEDPNRVKVVLDQRGNALYFSRSAIPYWRGDDAGAPQSLWQHVGLYAFRRDFLLSFVGLAATPAEQAEKLEQLRILEHGYRIRAAVVEGWQSTPVDIPEDLARVEEKLSETSS